MKTNIKMRVTPEQSKKVQEIVFANGGEWKITDPTSIQNTDKKTLFINKEKIITHQFDDVEYFEKHEFKEVDADLFIRTNGTCEEPKTEDNKMEWIEYDGQELEAGKEYLVTKSRKFMAVWRFNGSKEDKELWKETITAYAELPKPYEKPKSLKERLDEAVEKYCYEFSKEEWENSEMKKICIHYSHISKKFEIETRYAREIFSPYYFLDLFRAEAFIYHFTTEELMQIMKGEVK